MSKCESCKFFIRVPNDADDFEPGKGDCITEVKDEKGKYWLSTPVFQDTDACPNFNKAI
ncbi:benzylsuccinate synthase gamma subunit family protein [Desulfobacula toluolica]|uniref:BssC: benzylsuccinate synthase, gamma subunit n=1 Tax=Desulfobacula toluolica (strain DSM 7467 / Tol2) TaxID=651182 RepID=K0NC20_DESTT|nr:benzylsuccinate synthase gamma subunit family protein [Desulfobacula toluolica]CCK78311.1 BssC: benzylsuccinate synthase, gamma subunit [Desulfobacula toluolica Tol2]